LERDNTAPIVDLLERVELVADLVASVSESTTFVYAHLVIGIGVQTQKEVIHRDSLAWLLGELDEPSFSDKIAGIVKNAGGKDWLRDLGWIVRHSGRRILLVVRPPPSSVDAIILILLSTISLIATSV